MNFIDECRKLNVNVSNSMLDKFNIYYEFLTYYNNLVNLTSITKYEEVFIKHFYDSLTINNLVLDNKTLCDVGSGAGFPSVPLAIVNSSLKVTIIDALNKRIVFLNELIKKLNIDNVDALHYRAEDYVKIKGEFFDYVSARAVARLNILCEICLPLVKIGGYFIALKGSEASCEVDEAKSAISILGGEIVKTTHLELPFDNGSRSIVIIKKIKSSPKKYPRIFSVIKNKPL